MFGNENHEKIKSLQIELDNQNDMIGRLSGRIRELEFLIKNPAKYIKGQVMFKRYTICEVECKWISQCHYGYWSWEYKAFDSKRNMVITMQLDCCGNIIEEKECK